MNRYDLDVVIDREPDVVWDFVTDLRRTPEWRTTVRTIEPPDQLTVGAPFSGTTRLLGRTWTWELEITALDPPRRVAYVVTRGVASPTVEYVVEGLADGRTRFTMSGHVDEMSLLARLLKPLALRALRRETAIHLRQLKSLLESPAAAT